MLIGIIELLDIIYINKEIKFIKNAKLHIPKLI